ncbi:PLP-dependent aminotransferase family protein [Roseibium sp. SCP14]|uniref:MocR-like pyridoxine biosynthesis transcription factor PdxR n=1 Tax=Roseibium sp. SCP14 TaxID=3141375 RepID=UPI00333AF42B
MKLTSWLAFSIDRTSKTPIFEQICGFIREQAISGELPEGTRLPPTRVFATDLGISRSTVVTAYEQLEAEGYLQGLRGSGYTVCAMGQVELQGQGTRTLSATSETKVEPAKPFEISQADLRLFPHRQWATTVKRVCRTNPQSMLAGGSLFGCFELREAIADHVSEWRGINASAHQVIITAGSTDALEICVRAVCKTGDAIGLEEPGYLPVRRFASDYGLATSFLNIDGNGAELPSQGDHARLVVLTPSQQFPLGGAMSPSRRLEFIHWAEENNAWVVEDDYDSEFRYSGRPIPAMAGFDCLKRTIYIGSFSKTFSNSLRLGYMIAPEGLVENFHSAMKQIGVKASYMPQPALAEFMKSGEFHRHLRRVRRTYGERRKFLLNRLERDFTDFGSFKDHQAGMQVVLHLNSRFEDFRISQHAADKGMSVQPLSYYSTGDLSHNGLILGFCGSTEEELGRALDLLLSCFSET